MHDLDGGLLCGTLALLFLKALAWGPRHVRAVTKAIAAVSPLPA